jgi:septum formation protein
VTRQALPLVLASSSPRRRELLVVCGFDFQVVPADIDESRQPDEPAPLHTLRVAREKADSVAKLYPDLPVLGADTMVVVDGEALGKPRDRDDARAMLRRLSGRCHHVLTALALCHRGTTAAHLESATVTFVPLGDALIDWYLATGEGADKAGAYAVQGQGGLLVSRVEGNAQTVVGLPLAALLGLFGRVGLKLRAEGSRLLIAPRDDTAGNLT